jgi:rhodanese-related sulfurtransferase
MIETRKYLSVLILCAFGGLQGGCNDNISDRDIEYIGLAQVKAAVDEKTPKTYLIDPRAPQDFAQGHIPGASNLQLNKVSDKKDSLDPALSRYKLLIVYGQAPNSDVAKGMTKRLMRAGAKDVKMFNGGFLEWSRTGMPVEKTEPDAAAAPAR